MDGTAPTESLRKQHSRLAEGLARLWILVDSLQAGDDTKKPELLRALAFLEQEVAPHAEAEDCFLYPEVGRLMGCHQATATMNLDHQFISSYIRELRGQVDTAFGPEGQGLSAETLASIRAIAHRLTGLLRAHFEKEERIYFPLLDREMTAEEVRQRVSDPMAAMVTGTAGGRASGRSNSS